MGRPESPHGTVAAYKRHLRRKETPCDACRTAKRDAQREARKAPASAGVVVVAAAAAAATKPQSDDLQLIVDTLRAAFLTVAGSEPTKVAPIAREFRAAVAAAAEPAEPPREMSLADQLAEARAARAARAAG